MLLGNIKNKLFWDRECFVNWAKFGWAILRNISPLFIHLSKGEILLSRSRNDSNHCCINKKKTNCLRNNDNLDRVFYLQFAAIINCNLIKFYVATIIVWNCYACMTTLNLNISVKVWKEEIHDHQWWNIKHTNIFPWKILAAIRCKKLYS